MDFLVLAPPVCTPAEPPSGGFMLAAGLAGRGREAGFLDLSLEFYHRVLTDPEVPGPDVRNGLSYLIETAEGYNPSDHRSVMGALHTRLKGFSNKHPGWKLTLMDIRPPGRVHDPGAVENELARGPDPFGRLFETVLGPVLESARPKHVLVSVAYLSQLAGSVSLVRYLKERGIDPVVGGSLPRSLFMTGSGLGPLRGVFRHIDTSDGSSLIPGNGRLLDKLAWPSILSAKPYLSARPVFPLTLSVGCWWSRCLFCPDRTLPHHNVPLEAIETFLHTMPSEVAARSPVVHLLDSAMPPALLRRFLPLARAHGLGFYGFARPTRGLCDGQLLSEAAESGCLMLQLGVEGGSRPLLSRFDKGIDPAEAERCVRTAADSGIRTYLYLLFGLPTETDADRHATLDLVARCGDRADFLNVSMFNLPRFCELSRRASEFGITIEEFPGQDTGIRFYHPFRCEGSSPRKAARTFLKDRFLPHPFVHAATLRTPKWLRAAHMALMKLEGRRVHTQNADAA
jgi:hypothetical protein